MTKKRQHRKRNNTRTGMQFILGAGLVLIGWAAFMIVQGPQNTEAAQALPGSVIPIEVNYPAPELSLQTVNGKSESLVEYRDRIVLVNNWATWCPPCKAEIPTLEAYYETHANDGFVIIGIEAGETQKDVLGFVQEHAMTYPVWFDLNGAAMKAFHNESLPSSYVIDRQGIVRYSWVGEISQEMLEKYITPLLQ